jgi:transcription antitermination factor NusG
MQTYYTNISESITSLVGWLVLYTQPLREFAVDYQLSNKGHLTYLPITQRCNIPIPLFSRYIFLANPQNDFTFLRKVKYIQTILQQDDKPIILHDSIIQSLRERENEKGFIPTEATELQISYIKDSGVNIIDGPYSGLKATFNKRINSHRAEINLNFFGSKRAVQIGLDQIEICY